MEAIATAPIDKDQVENTVLIIAQKGYKFSNNKILRPTRVIVGKK